VIRAWFSTEAELLVTWLRHLSKLNHTSKIDETNLAFLGLFLVECSWCQSSSTTCTSRISTSHLSAEFHLDCWTKSSEPWSNWSTTTSLLAAKNLSIIHEDSKRKMLMSSDSSKNLSIAQRSRFSPASRSYLPMHNSWCLRRWQVSFLMFLSMLRYFIRPCHLPNQRRKLQAAKSWELLSPKFLTASWKSNKKLSTRTYKRINLTTTSTTMRTSLKRVSSSGLLRQTSKWREIRRTKRIASEVQSK